VTGPGETPRPDDPPSGADHPPYVYNPYADVSYPATYPVPPAGLGGDDPAPPARRPGVVHLALLLLVVAALPYLLIGLFGATAAGDLTSAVPPGQLPPLAPGVDLAQVVRAAALVMLGVAVVYLLLAVLAWTGRGWARALLAATTAGFALMVAASVAAASSQGLPMDGAGLLVLAFPVVLAAVGVALLFGPAARAWFGRRRR
jgi:hypothetical protein